MLGSHSSIITIVKIYVTCMQENESTYACLHGHACATDEITEYQSVVYIVYITIKRSPWCNIK